VTARRVIGVVVVLAGVVLLVCGGGLLAVFLRYEAMVPMEPPEQSIIGTWQLDAGRSSYNPLVQKIEGGITLEFKKDGTYRLTAGGPAQEGTYAVTGKTGQTLKLTLTPADGRSPSSDLFVEVRDKGRLYVDHRTLSGFEVTRQ
jgi:hypothetical protein